MTKSKSRYVCCAFSSIAPKLKNAHVLRAFPVLALLMQAPDVPNPRAAIALPAVPAPHAGTSYNPPEAAHTSLLRAAHEAELRRVQEAEALEAIKARILSARHSGGDGDGGALGMLIDKPGEGEDDGALTEQDQDGLEQYDSAGLEKKKSVLQRKTKQQRRKAEKLRAEVCDSTYFFSPSPHVWQQLLETIPFEAYNVQTVACVGRHCQNLTQGC